MDIQSVKQRFGLIGDSPGLNRALETALRVSTTDLSVLVSGESGVGKETIPNIIHANSSRKHGKYIAVNCGAIPEGTMDSELFGHVKGSFTGASAERKGYFEEANGGTIFLDEVAEMPLGTQVKLLRILESGEFIKVGSSSVQKTDVRVVAATNVNVIKAIEKGKFREDLYYRLNTVPITLPPLRERKEDVHLLFRKFAYDFSEKYRMPVVRLTADAVQMLANYYWHGNIRQLKNVAEQLSILETERSIGPEILVKFLPDFTSSRLPAVIDPNQNPEQLSERELLYKVIIDMRKEVNDLKQVVGKIMGGKDVPTASSGFEEHQEASDIIPTTDYQSEALIPSSAFRHPSVVQHENTHGIDAIEDYDEHIEVEESLSLAHKEKELIQKALSKHRGKRKYAAKDLGISERTLYRKIKEYNLN